MSRISNVFSAGIHIKPEQIKYAVSVWDDGTVWIELTDSILLDEIRKVADVEFYSTLATHQVGFWIGNTYFYIK